jgi:hypothetical protein
MAVNKLLPCSNAIYWPENSEWTLIHANKAKKTAQ